MAGHRSLVAGPAGRLRVRAALAVQAPLSRIVAGDGGRVDVTCGAGSVLVETLRADDGDVFIGQASAAEALVARGVLRADACMDLVRSTTAFAVRAGPRPPAPLRDEHELRALIASAQTICISAAASGRAFLELAVRLGMAERVRPRLVRPAPGELVGDVLCRGQAHLGFQQVAEFLPFPELAILALPPGFGSGIDYRACVFVGSTRGAESSAWCRHLLSPTARTAWHAGGLAPYG